MGFLARNKNFIGYAIAMAALLTLMRWLEIRLLFFRHSFEIYAGAIAIIFTALGIWLAIKVAKPKKETVIVEKEIPAPTKFVFNQNECDRLGISKRELEVLQLMASGLSNAEIADQMFVSANTIKTHAAKLFEKLDVRRRTQAVERAKRLGLLP